MYRRTCKFFFSSSAQNKRSTSCSSTILSISLEVTRDDIQTINGCKLWYIYRNNIPLTVISYILMEPIYSTCFFATLPYSQRDMTCCTSDMCLHHFLSRSKMIKAINLLSALGRRPERKVNRVGTLH